MCSRCDRFVRVRAQVERCIPVLGQWSWRVSHFVGGCVVGSCSGANHMSCELWSPTRSREPEAHELVRRALALAQGSLCEAASHRRLEELETHLVRVRGVPFAMGLWSSQQSLVQFRDRAGSAP